MPPESTIAAASTGVSPGIEKYLARQPIFDRREMVFGYELLRGLQLLLLWPW